MLNESRVYLLFKFVLVFFFLSITITVLKSFEHCKYFWTPGNKILKSTIVVRIFDFFRCDSYSWPCQCSANPVSYSSCDIIKTIPKICTIILWRKYSARLRESRFCFCSWTHHVDCPSESLLNILMAILLWATSRKKITVGRHFVDRSRSKLIR